jgi:hypothetical protein
VWLLAAGLLAVALGGCGVLGQPGSSSVGSRTGSRSRSGVRPANGSQARQVRSSITRADRTHEVPTPARAERVLRGWATPQRAVRVFTSIYVNWTASTVSARLRSLARDSVGQARAMLELQAREVAADGELHRGRIANSGVVEAVGGLAGGSRRFVVVTRESTRAADDAAYRGLAPEWHVSLATVRRIGGRWVLSSWQPEN